MGDKPALPALKSSPIMGFTAAPAWERIRKTFAPRGAIKSLRAVAHRAYAKATSAMSAEVCCGVSSFEDDAVAAGRFVRTVANSPPVLDEIKVDNFDFGLTFENGNVLDTLKSEEKVNLALLKSLVIESASPVQPNNSIASGTISFSESGASKIAKAEAASLDKHSIDEPSIDQFNFISDEPVLVYYENPSKSPKPIEATSPHHSDGANKANAPNLRFPGHALLEQLRLQQDGIPPAKPPIEAFHHTNPVQMTADYVQHLSTSSALESDASTKQLNTASSTVESAVTHDRDSMPVALELLTITRDADADADAEAQSSSNATIKVENDEPAAEVNNSEGPSSTASTRDEHSQQADTAANWEPTARVSKATVRSSPMQVSLEQNERALSLADLVAAKARERNNRAPERLRAKARQLSDKMAADLAASKPVERQPALDIPIDVKQYLANKNNQSTNKPTAVAQPTLAVATPRDPPRPALLPPSRAPPHKVSNDDRVHMVNLAGRVASAAIERGLGAHESKEEKRARILALAKSYQQKA